MKHYTRWIAGGVLYSFLATSTIFAQPVGTVSVVLNGQTYPLKTEPVIQSNTTMVGMREIFELLDAKVDWKETEKKIIASKGDKTIELYIGSNKAVNNGEEIELSVAPKMEQGMTLVPLRWVGEALDADIDWRQEEKVIYITTEKEENKSDTAKETINNDVKLPEVILKPVQYVNAKELNLEEAKKKAINGNISLKLQSIAISTTEEAFDITKNGIIIPDENGTGYTVIADDSVSGIIRKNTAKLQADGAKNKEELIKNSIEFLVQKTFEEIIQLEKQLSIAEASLQISKESLDMTKTRFILGLESEYNLSIAQKGYEQLENQLENLKSSIDLKYLELNNLIGEKPDTRFILKEELVYTPLESINLNQFINKKIAEDFYVWYSQENLKLQKLELDTYEWSPTNTYALQKAKYDQAVLTEKLTRQNLDKALRERYNQILQLEQVIEVNKLNLQKAEEAYNQAKQQYALGNIIPLQVKQAQLEVYNAELELEKTIIQHNQLKQTFYNPYLNPSYNPDPTK